MKKILLASLALLSFNLLASTQDEINHLQHFVERTKCLYERNGEMHNGADALQHINKKYKYFESDVNSAEDFIKFAATKSKMTGNYYLVHCDNDSPIKSLTWLTRELEAYRAFNQ